VPRHIADEADECRGVGDHLCTQALLHDRLDHIALILCPIKIASRQQLALPHEPQCFVARDRDLSLGIVETLRAESGLVRHRHAVQILGEPDEPFEIDQHHMIHADAGQVLQRTHGQRGASERERRIDLVPAEARDIDPHVARERDDVRLVTLCVQMYHQDRVAATVTFVPWIAAVRTEQHIVQRA
jgi:hypothetical protein